jgi:hypothetical protein
MTLTDVLPFQEDFWLLTNGKECMTYDREVIVFAAPEQAEQFVIIIGCLDAAPVGVPVREDLEHIEASGGVPLIQGNQIKYYEMMAS